MDDGRPMAGRAEDGGECPVIRRRARLAAEGLHLVCLGAWAGSLAMTAATAAIIVPTMRDLSPALPEYGGYPEDHWVIGAGQVMEQVFTVSDVAQVALGGIACALFVPIALSERRGRSLLAVRAFVLAALFASVLQYTFVMRGEMSGALVRFWSAAETGNVEAANEARAAFDELHPRASLRLSLHMAGAAIGIALCVYSLWRRSGDEAPRQVDGTAE